MKRIESLKELESHLETGTKYFKYAHNGRMYSMRDITIKKTSIGRILGAIKREKLFVSDYDAAKALINNEHN
jgi:hypothetical protein